MSKFAPMVKMNTTEPSVILKLKKGGKVKSKNSEDCGHKPMSSHAMGGVFESEAGQSPKRPSMAARNKAMNPNLYAKGGKVAHKVLGGGMGGVPTVNPMGGMMGAQGAPAMNPMGAAALGKMAPNARAKRAMQVRKALTGMKKGGSADPKCCAALEKELKHHESLKSDVAHHADGGSAIDRSMTRTTLKNSVKPFVSKVDTVKPDNKVRKTGEVKQGNGGGYKTGGATKAYAAGGTIEGNEGRFENTKVNTARPFSGSKDTGGVRMSNAGGFKKGGTIEGGNWENRAANTTPKGVSGTKTGEVKKANAGGYKSGGNTSKKAYATGGDVDMGQADRTLRQSSRGDENRSYDVVNKSGKAISNHKSQSDAMRAVMKNFDDYSVKRKYASGGNVVDDGKAVKMPKHFVSRPVANSLQSGTFKRGGKVKHHAAGGSEPFGTFEDEDSASVAKKAKPAPKSSKSKEEADRIRLRDEGMNMFDDQSAKAKGGKVDSPIKGTRKVASYGDEEHTVQVRFDPDWQDYQVHHYKHGKHQGEGPVSYHGMDKEDAHDTAKYMIKNK
jgi:hypothetical protein